MTVRIFEPPPLRESWKLTTPSGRRFRWAEDEPKAENVPFNASYSSSMQGGYKDASVTLPRKPEVDYADLERGSRLEVFTCGHRVGQYRLDRAPRASGDQIAITPQAVGYIAALEDDKSAAEIFVDRDMSGWGEPSARRIAAWTAAQVNLNAQSSLLAAGDPSGASVPALSHAWSHINNFTATSPDVAESWYDSGGVELGRLTLDFVNVKGIGVGDADWENSPYAAPDDTGSPIDQLADFNGTSSADQAFTIAAARYFLFLRDYYTVNQNADGNWEAHWQNIAVWGRHGLTPQGSMPNEGVLASDVIAYALGKWVPGVKFTTGPSGTIRPSTYVIPHLVFKDRGTAGDMYRGADAFELSDFAIWDGPDGEPTAYYAARGTFGRKWRARVREARLQETGPQMDRVWNGVLVRWQDVDGTTKVVGPTGSDCQITSDSLLDTDPLNPANQLGIRKWTMLDMQEVALFTDAIRAGQRFLEESSALDSSGQATIVGYVMDSGGRVFPHTHIRAGDEISFIDASDTSYRRIVNVQHERPTRSSQLDLDSPPDSLQQILARLRVSLIGAGM